MDPRQLRHFIALAEERSFTKAAAREFIVQSGLSASIRSLERELGADLYVKGTRPVRLTAEGEALVPAARHALDAFEATYQTVNAVSGRIVGHLRMGVFQNISHLVPIGSVLSGFFNAHPGIELTLRQLPSMEMVAMVSSGELDCAIVNALAEPVLGVEISPLAEERLDLVINRDHPFAGRESIEIAELEGATFVETAVGFATRRLSDQVFSAAGLSRRIVCEVSGWPMVVDLVSAGLGMAFLPRGIAQTSSGLHTLPVTGLRLSRRIDFATPGGNAASPATRELAGRLDTAMAESRSSRGALS